MELQVGDKVRFLNDVGGGTVSRIIDRRSVMVMNDFGFEVPTPANELVFIESAPVYETSKKQEPDVKDTKKTVREEEVLVDTADIFYPDVTYDNAIGDNINIYFAFVPKGRPGNSDLDVYLINDSNYNVLYSIIDTDENNLSASNMVGVLEANTKELTETLAFANINQIPGYQFHLIFYRKGEFIVKDPVVKQLTINPVKFFKEKTYVGNDFFDQEALIFSVYNESPLAAAVNELSQKELIQVITKKEQKEEKPVFSSSKEKESKIIEVDLHIHELMDDFRGLTNAEILEIQMSHFKTQLNEAQRNGIKRIVFIHGVGNGVLKMEIRKELDRLKSKLSYQDASFREYGYGATLVQL
ncbi:MAG: DUF2027 domain-containing protein [Salinivirgaceae bacterium]|nr:DUF2027 domain-containing protein [Salinivirgaceae bacterium]